MNEEQTEEQNIETHNDSNTLTDGKLAFLNESNDGLQITSISGMFQNWFLDYASYVILERAVPALSDGLKPVQRRILHSMKEMDDGRYNKVANIIGNTMKYHPHGDVSIGDALVQLGQKDLLIDMQGNWGNILTGDSAAAPRYIEARLSKFAREVVFNAKTTQYIKSYDARNDEPIHLPIKFPLLLAQGAEGIAVGMACKIFPHNFNEILEACVKVLKEEDFVLYPDFQTGGLIDISHYNDGLRGGKIRIRARIKKTPQNDLIIYEIPFGTTTSSLIESIVKANDKGKIKIKKIEDNTSENAEILIQLPTGVAPDKTIDGLYAFTDCEISISPNSSVIDVDKPMFLGVTELLKESTHQTVKLLKLELDLQLAELLESFYFSSLEKLFIENKIYIGFDGKTYEEAKALTFELLKPYFPSFYREVKDEDIEKLLEIKMRRITKHDAEEANIALENIKDKMEKVRYYLANLIEYAIAYFKHLKKTYGKDKERKTEIKIFDTIQAREVIVNNKKLYINKTDGFIGYGLKKDEYICDCSDLDDIIVVLKDGKLLVTPIAEKKFVGKNIIYAAIWRKADTRTVYHLIYRDGEKGYPMGKRFLVKAITRDKEYDLTRGTAGTYILYFSVHPNGEKEIINVQMQPIGGLKQLQFDFDFSQIPIRTMSSIGQKITNRIIKSITQKEIGESTLAAQPVWYDKATQRLSIDSQQVKENSVLLGEFMAEDQILCIYKSGYYQILPFNLSHHFQEDLGSIVKFDPTVHKELAAIYFDGERKNYYAKRFSIEAIIERKMRFITDHPESMLLHFSFKITAKVKISFAGLIRGQSNAQQTFIWSELTELKSITALGKDLGKAKILKVD